MNAAFLLAAAAPSQPCAAHASQGRWDAVSCSAPPRSLDDLLRSDHILCARLEHMTVSTWNMMEWAPSMTSDLVLMTSKVCKMIGVKGANGLSKLKQLCFIKSQRSREWQRTLTCVPPADCPRPSQNVANGFSHSAQRALWE